jgi:hypothetical protein
MTGLGRKLCIVEVQTCDDQEFTAQYGARREWQELEKPDVSYQPDFIRDKYDIRVMKRPRPS